MRRIMMAIGLLLLGMTGGHVAIAAPDSCDVPLAWGDARSMLETELRIEFEGPPWGTRRRTGNALPLVSIERRPLTTFLVLFQGADGTVRVVSAAGCEALVTITRN